MKKTLFVLSLALLTPTALMASQRVIVIEDFTATWCTYCPGAARGIEELDLSAFDTIVPIAYHPSSSDPYYNAVSVTRMNYYGVGGYPTVRLDGNFEVVGGMHTGNMYPTYRQFFDTRKTVTSPFEIDLAGTYDSASRQGRLDIRLRNTTSSAVTGQLHVAVIQNHIYHPWQGMDSLQYLVLDMLPNGSGVSVTVPANDSLDATRDFTLDAAWVARNCQLVVFVQNTSTKQMYQGARIGVYAEPEFAYVDHGSAFPAPGGTAELSVGVRNIGTAAASGITGTLSTTDPYVTVTQPNSAYPQFAVATDGRPLTPFSVNIDSSCPGDHVATLRLTLAGADDVVAALDFPMNITSGSGMSDDMERGMGGWTHSGIRNAWHLQTYRSNSPSNSWYCGADANHQYNVETDMRLVSPYFSVAAGGSLSFYHWYRTEATFDFAMVEVNTGGPFWVPLAMFDGVGANWQQVTRSLAAYEGKTTRVRFRFISDGSVNDEGWYIDDVLVTPHVTGVAEERPGRSPRLVAMQSVASGAVRVEYGLAAGAGADLAVYDASGRLVRSLADALTGSGQIEWKLDDARGRRIDAGTYFVRMATTAGARSIKVVVAR